MIRSDINEIESKMTVDKFNATELVLKKKKNTIDKTSTRLSKEKRENSLINKMTNERGEITNCVKQIQRSQVNVMNN